MSYKSNMQVSLNRDKTKHIEVKQGSLSIVIDVDVIYFDREVTEILIENYNRLNRTDLEQDDNDEL